MDAVRYLSSVEIEMLHGSGCRADDWRNIRVGGDFSPESVSHTAFSGQVTLGTYKGEIAVKGMPFLKAGIRHCRLHNVSVGSGCHIENATIANTDIEDNVLVQEADFIGQVEQSSFGNGSPVNCIAEDGARSVPLWCNLSSQWAHLILHVKGTGAGQALENMILKDAETFASARSRIGAGCRIQFAGMLKNVRLGPGTIVENTAKLTNVHTVSTEAAPVFIGEGVAAEECVIQQKARINGGVRLAHCFVGEAVKLDNAFFAKHSLFFANSDFSLGEAACAMAGPFAVSHHRATLVLTCQNSFSTFGSGANSSNHHFKLGPRHGGILRRGTRCGSGSYLFWPSDIGAFTTIVGKHTKNLDTAAFPFSLVTTSGDRTVLVPGVNLFSAGLFRNERKWRERDGRERIEQPRDLYESAVFSPYSMEAAEIGLEVLRSHKEAGGKDLLHNGAIIPASRLDVGILLYETALMYYVGRVLLEGAAERFGRSGTGEVLALVDEVAPQEDGAGGNWRDWGGMLVSGERAEAFLRDVADGTIENAAGVTAGLARMHGEYRRDEVRWVAGRWRKRFGGRGTRADVSAFMEKWLEKVMFSFERQVRDVAKEFGETVMYGYGVEGDGRESFRRVRGKPADEESVGLMQEERDRLMALGYAAVE